MRNAFIKVYLGIAILLSAVIGVYADETLQYELISEKVEKASVFEIEGSYYIHVKLKEPYVKEFSELTGNNIGKRLEIIFSGRIFSAAVIRARIESGRIRSKKLSSEEDAKRIMKALNEYNDDIEVPAKKDKQNEKFRL